MGPSQISDTPFQGNVVLSIDFWRCLWTRFGPTRVRAPQKVLFFISMGWSAEKGLRRSGSQVPVKIFVSLAACTSGWSFGWHYWFSHDYRESSSQLTNSYFSEGWPWPTNQTSLPCKCSLTLHVSLRNFDCLTADFISPLLLFSEASLRHWQTSAVAEGSFHWLPHVGLHSFACLLLTLCCCFMKLLAGKVLQHQQIPSYLENQEVNFRDAVAMPKRTPFSVPDTQVHISVWRIQVFWWQAR